MTRSFLEISLDFSQAVGVGVAWSKPLTTGTWYILAVLSKLKGQGLSTQPSWGDNLVVCLYSLGHEVCVMKATRRRHIMYIYMK